MFSTSQSSSMLKLRAGRVLWKVAAVAATGITSLYTQRINAAAITWSGAGTNANWNNGANWVGGVKPNDVARFTGNFTATAGTNGAVTNVNNNGNQTLNQIFFDGPTNAFSINTPANTITLNAVGTGGIGILRQDGASPAAATQTINTSIVLGADQVWQIDGTAGQVTLNNSIVSGAFNITKTGARPLVFGKAYPAFTGQTIVNEGSVIVQSDADLGAGTQDVIVGAPSGTSGASLYKQGSGTTLFTFNRNVTVRAGASGVAEIGSNGNATPNINWTGNVSLQKDVSLLGGTAAGGAVEFSGVIADSLSNFVSSNVVKNGLGTVTLSNANTYSGATTVAAGKLLVNGSLSNSSAAVTVLSGATLGGSGTINRPVVVQAGGVLAPGAAGSGSLTVNGSVGLQEGSTVEWELGSSPASSGLINTVLFSGTGAASIRLLAGANSPDSNATYTLLSWSGADDSSIPSFTIDPLSTLTGTISFVGANDGTPGGQVVITNLAAAVPEPIGLTPLAATGLLLVRRRHATEADSNAW